MGGPETAAAVPARYRHRAGPRRLMMAEKRKAQVQDFYHSSHPHLVEVEVWSEILPRRAHADLRERRMMTRINREKTEEDCCILQKAQLAIRAW